MFTFVQVADGGQEAGLCAADLVRSVNIIWMGSHPRLFYKQDGR